LRRDGAITVQRDDKESTMRWLISSSAILCLAMALWPSVSFADGALAIGLPGGDPRNGFVAGLDVNMPADRARAEALKDCRGVDVQRTNRARSQCKIVETFQNQCANTAFNGDRETPSTGVGWGVGPDSATADRRALAMCENMRSGRGRPCKPDGEPFCDGDAK
jgi:uncharacterized protein DUF4189